MKMTAWYVRSDNTTVHVTCVYTHLATYIEIALIVQLRCVIVILVFGVPRRRRIRIDILAVFIDVLLTVIFSILLPWWWTCLDVRDIPRPYK